MAIEGADGGGQDLDLITASLRADASDMSTFIEVLAAKLEDAIPGSVRVLRWRGRMFGPKQVGRITIDAAGRRHELRRAGDGIETTCSRLSGGIVLKTETVDTDTWLTALAEALAEQAKRSQTTRQALERLLNG
jgi:hypothetical protein